MSIVRMRKIFRKRVNVKIRGKELSLPSWTEIIFGLIILIFLVGAYYTFGGPASGGGKNQAFMKAQATGPVAKVNGFKISREVFAANVANRMQGGPMGEVDFTQERWVKSSVLDALIEQVLIRQAAQREGIKVTSADVNKKKDELVEQVMAQRFADKRQLRNILRKEKKTLDEYKASLRQELGRDAEAFQDQLAEEKLKKQVEDRIQVSDQDLQDSYTEIHALHILIDPKKAAEKAQGGKDGAKPDGDVLAKAKADQLLKEIKGGADFGKLATANSDDPGSGSKGGDLGFFKRGMMVKEFEEAAFKLQDGQVSEVVKSPFGYHIIKVVGRRSTLPKDFATKKETYRTQLKDERKYKAWNDYREELKKTATIQILDRELTAYKDIDEGKFTEGKALLTEVAAGDPDNLCANWELATLEEQSGNNQAAVDILDKLAVSEQGARSAMLHLKRGDLYAALKNKGKALEAYKQAADWSSAYTMQNMSMQMQLQSKVSALGDKGLATEIQKWLDDYRKTNPQGANPFGNMIQMPPQ